MAHDLNLYFLQQEVVLEAHFYLGTTLTDPTTVKFYLKDPDEVAIEREYGVHPEIVKEDTGIYTYSIVVSMPGIWYYRWQAMGNIAAASEKRFQVLKSDILPIP